MDDQLREFINLDQPFGPITAPAIEEFGAFATLFDTENDIAREMRRRPTLIIGRRGAGKTAFLHSLSLGDRYATIIVLEPGEAFATMIRSIENDLPQSILVEETAQLWRNLLGGAIFRQLLAEFPLDAGGKLLPVARYLDGLGIDQGMSLYAVMRAILQALKSVNAGMRNLIEAGENLVSRGVTFPEAMRCADDFMQDREVRGVLLVDSLEQFPLDEPTMEKTVQGLLRCVGSFNQAERPFELRCCFPSELYPRLLKLSANPLKDFASQMVLHWRPYELLHLAALRYRTFIRLNEPKAFATTFSHLDLADRQDLKTFWAHVMPPTVRNRLGMEEESTAYLMRHTQLLPRHLLLYLNEISKRALRTNGRSFRFSEDNIVEGIRASEHVLCHEIFSGFRQVMPHAEEACRGVLSELPLVFGKGNLHKIFNRKRRTLEHFEDHEEVLGNLLRIGALGVVTNQTERYTLATFDYTISDNLHYRGDDDFCVHPIFLEQYRVRLEDGKKIYRPVYPSGSETAFD